MANSSLAWKLKGHSTLSVQIIDQTELPYDPAIPHVGICPKKTKTPVSRDTGIPTSPAELPVRAQPGEPPRHTPVHEAWGRCGGAHKGVLLSKRKEWRAATGPRV